MRQPFTTIFLSHKLAANVHSIAKPLHKRLKGFSLVELMVAMTIGLFGVLIMTQVFSLSEQNKRSTTSGNDAMNEGVVAMYAVQRDVRMGGFGVADVKLLGCNVLLRAGVTLVALAPVTINHASIPAGDANTDTLVVVYANTNGSTEGDSTNAAGDGVMTPTSFAVNNWIIVAPAVRPDPPSAVYAAACVPTLTLDQVATVVVNPSSMTLTSGAALGTGARAFNLGPRVPRIVAYAIRGGSLAMCDYTASDCSANANITNAAVWVPIASNIVSLRAQYGRDTAAASSMDGIVDIYDQTAPTTACDWVRVSAVRLALVARSGQPQASITTVAPVWDGSATNPINLSGNSAWQNYRYKVFQTVAPVRNISWMGRVSGC